MLNVILLCLTYCTAQFNSLNLLKVIPYMMNTTNTECRNAVFNMLNHFIGNKQINNLLLYSGKGINDLGNYPDCTDSGNVSRYVTLYLKDMPASIALGICGPSNCTASDYSVLKAPLVKELQGIIQSVPSMSNFNFTENTIQFYDPIEREKQSGNVGVGFIITYIIVALIVGFIIFFTYVDFKSKQAELEYNKKMGQIKEQVFSSISKPDIEENTMLINRSSQDISDIKIRMQSDSIQEKTFTPFKKGPLQRVAGCISLFRTWHGLIYSVNKKDPNLDILNGIRTLMAMWVVFGHNFLTFLDVPLANLFSVTGILQGWWFSIVLMAPLSVDAFFFMGAFLAGAFMIDKCKNKKLNPLLAYANRYLRLLPSYIMSMLFYTFAFPPMVRGPVSYLEYDKSDNCHYFWWTHFLYINNFDQFIFPNKVHECMGFSWYLADDMQFFIITPAILYAFAFIPIVGWILVGALAGVCIAVTIYLCVVYDISLNVTKYNAHYFNDYYYVPYTRILPYLVGLMFGLAYASYKNPKSNDWMKRSFQKLESNITYCVVCYCVGFILIFWCVFLNYFMMNYTWGKFPDSLFLIAVRPIFVIGLGLIILPVIVGKGNVLRNVLGCGIFNVFAKLTFNIYMFHEMFIFTYAYSQKTALYFAQYDIVLYAIGTFGTASLASLIISLFVEAPLGNLQREFLEGPPPKGSRPKQVSIHTKQIEEPPAEIVGTKTDQKFPIPIKNADEILKLFNKDPNQT